MRLGRACITHAPPRTVGAPGRMRFKEASDVDYAGHYAGAPVAFDAKSWTDKASYRLPSPTENGGKDLARHLRQIEWLRKFAETGQRGNATAFFLLHCSKLDVCWVLDLTLLHHLSRNPTKSIPIRTLNRDGTITHHLPHVPEAPTLAIAQGQPRWDFLHVAFSA